MFLGEPSFSASFHKFHKALTLHYAKGGKHLYDPAAMKVFSDECAPGLFGEIYKAILNDDKEKPSLKRVELQKVRVVSMLHSLSFFRNQVHCMHVSPFPTKKKKRSEFRSTEQ